MLRVFFFSTMACLLYGTAVQAQHEGDNWVFGWNAGMRFMPDSTITFFQSSQYTREGVASISDPATGDLLFYTDGKSVWDRNHTPMPNGTGLLGDYSAAQSAVIIPKPGSKTRYYIFTAPHLNQVGAPYNYSEVDMTLNGGLGDVIIATKNTPLGDNATEKLTVARHCNNRDFWVIMRHANGNRFSVRLVNPGGVQAAQSFNLGGFVNNDSWNKANYLKLSQDQHLLVHPIGPPSLSNYISTVEMFSFDNATGTISGPLFTLDGFGYAYAAEFSADNRLLYVSDISTQGISKIFQFDISSGSAPLIQASKTQLVSSNLYDYGALQMGPDGKIYAAKEAGYNTGSKTLDVIQKPSVAGLGCNYQEDGLTLQFGKTLIGLPNIPNYVFRPQPDISFTKNCTTGDFQFSIPSADTTGTIDWTFGDPGSGGSNSATGAMATHSFANAGTYTVHALYNTACGSYNISASVIVRKTPLLADTSFCEGGAIILKGPVANTRWNNTSNGSTFIVTQPGPVMYEFTDSYGCLIRDTIYVQVTPPADTTITFSLCPGVRIDIGGMVYSAPDTVLNTLPGNNGDCDTIVTYVLELLPQPTRAETVALCPGATFSLGGMEYSAPNTVLDTLPGANGGCDTIVTYTLKLLPQPTRAETVTFCPGQVITIGGTEYSAPGVVLDTLPGVNGGCDTIVTYTLELLPQPTRAETVTFCPGQVITIGSAEYSAPGAVLDTLPGVNGGCDTIVTYTLELLPQPTRAETITFCPGQVITIGSTEYSAPGAVLDTLPGVNGGCDTIVTYTLELLPQPTRAETITFCPSETITIGGQLYTQAAIVKDTIPAIGGGCDTIVTYTLQSLTPVPSTVSITCPANINMTVDMPTAVTYDPAQASSDCPCPGIAVERTAGLPSGSVFPSGVTNVCYTATDSCGNSNSCCFSVTISETKPCDIKIIGCLKFELLSLTRDAAANTTFRIRVTNYCNDELVYTLFQLPKGIVAKSPIEKSIYAAPSGRDYAVRNPNFSPVYSIRYTPVGTGISGGESDVFEYILPPNTFPDYINVLAKVRIQTYYEAHLNTFYCPIGITPAPSASRNDLAFAGPAQNLYVYPNPTTGTLFVDLSNWEAKQVVFQVFDSRGLCVQRSRVTAEAKAQEIRLPEGLAGGLYFLEVVAENGEKQVVRFVVER